MSDETELLLPCPWCGDLPTVKPWHGGLPTKHLIGCINDDCGAQPSVTGQTRSEAIAQWNTRAWGWGDSILRGAASNQHEEAL